MKYQTQLALP